MCSKHFTSDCFEEDSAIVAKFGIEKRRHFKPNAVPTVFLRDTGGECSSRKRAGQEVSVPMEKKRMVYEKRERSRVYLVFVTWAQVVCLICAPRGTRAAGPRAEGVHIR